jgi:hypothetical protein
MRANIKAKLKRTLLANLERKSVTECSKKVTLRFCYVTEVWMVGFRIVTMSGQRTRLPYQNCDIRRID